MLKPRLLFVLLVLCFTSVISNAQAIVIYDEDAQIFCVDIDKCDPCILGLENSEICKCREACVIEENNCLEHCAHLVGNAYDHCLSKCYADNVHTCREACGPFEATKWPYIDVVLLSLQVLATDIPFHPLIETGPNQEIIKLAGHSYSIDEQGFGLKNFYKFDDNCVDISDHDISGFNLCFTYSISILIGESGTDERRECFFQGEYCIIKG